MYIGYDSRGICFAFDVIGENIMKYKQYEVLASVYDALNPEIDYTAWSDFVKNIIDKSRKDRGASSDSLDSIVCTSVRDAYEELMKIVSGEEVVFIGGSSFKY